MTSSLLETQRMQLDKIKENLKKSPEAREALNSLFILINFHLLTEQAMLEILDALDEVERSPA